MDHRESFLCWEVHTITILYVYLDQASQVAPVIENLPADAGYVDDRGLIPESGRSPGRGQGNPWTAWEIPWQSWQCLGNPMDQRNLVGYGPQVHRESDTTEVNLAHTHI